MFFSLIHDVCPAFDWILMEQVKLHIWGPKMKRDLIRHSL